MSSLCKIYNKSLCAGCACFFWGAAYGRPAAAHTAALPPAMCSTGKRHADCTSQPVCAHTRAVLFFVCCRMYACGADEWICRIGRTRSAARVFCPGNKSGRPKGRMRRRRIGRSAGVCHSSRSKKNEILILKGEILSLPSAEFQLQLGSAGVAMQMKTNITIFRGDVPGNLFFSAVRNEFVGHDSAIVPV